MYIVQRLGCLQISDGCISSCSDTSDIQEVPAVCLLPPGISVHGLTIQNVPKSVDFHETYECNSSTFMPTCCISIPIPRRLANKRSDTQSTYLSHKIHNSNGTESGLHTKSKEVRFDTNTTIHIYRYGISNSAENSQSSSWSSESSYSDHQNNSFSDSGFGTNFPFSFGQTQCSSRLILLGRLHLWPLQMCQLSVWKPHILPLDHQVTINSMIKFHLKWWMYSQSFHSGDAHSPSRPQNFPLYVCQPLRLGGSSRISESILSWSQLHINMLEIMAIRFALIKALKYIHHSCVMCLIYQQSRGNTFSQPMRRGMEDTSLVRKTSDYRQDLSYSRQIQCFGRQVIENRQTIMKTCLCNIDPLKPHFI